jgi:antitoxin component YwqK of YwqJK toxin-antitoxin module
MKGITLFLCLLFNLALFSQNVLETQLVSQNSIYHYNQKPFTGFAIKYFSRGQIESICELKDGLKTGKYISFYEDLQFEKSRFKDSSAIRNFELEVSKTISEINVLINDTLSNSNKINSYFENEIGGEKKLLKLKEKFESGNLKGKKLDEYNSFVSLKDNQKNSVIELIKLENDLKSIREKLEQEMKKSNYTGLTRENYQQINGIKNGSYVTYYENGNKKSEGSFKDGNFNDSWVFYFENGKIKEEINYFNNYKNGIYKYYYLNGKLKESGSFKDDNYHGNYISYFENGNIEKEGKFIDGKYDELWSFNFENGNPKGKGSFKMSDGSEMGSTGIPKNGRTGIWRFFHDNGLVKDEFNYIDGKINGNFKSFNELGKIKTEGSIKNDKIEGLYTSYYENGKISDQGIYVNGKKNGLFKKYFQSGILQAEVNYKDDLIDGLVRKYFENGNLETEGNFTGDLANGVFKTYDQNGKLLSEVNFSNGNEQGEIKKEKVKTESQTKSSPLMQKITNSINQSFNEANDHFLNGRTFAQKEYDLDYKCVFCLEKTINGCKNGYDDKGVKYNPANYIKPLESIYSPVGLRSAYPYCSPKCAKLAND